MFKLLLSTLEDNYIAFNGLLINMTVVILAAPKLKCPITHGHEAMQCLFLFWLWFWIEKFYPLLFSSAFSPSLKPKLF